MKNIKRTMATSAFLITSLACGTSTNVAWSPSDGQSIPAAIEPSASQQIIFLGIGEGGIFDPSFTADGQGRVWMSYSAVDPTPLSNAISFIRTRLAYSDDEGATWTDLGITLNGSEILTLPPPNEELQAVWQHEVSQLIYDPYAEDEARWKVFWHEYLAAYDPAVDAKKRLFEHGWIAMQTAADPGGPWSDARRLFIGRGYNDVNDASSPGRPEFHLDQLFPAKDQLGRCAAFTEPGVIAREEGLYISLDCGTGGDDSKLILLRCDHALSSCMYLGDWLQDFEAAHFGTSYLGFSASELVEEQGRFFLFVTPTEDSSHLYRGCMLFEVEDLENAALMRTDGIPDLLYFLTATKGSFNGACGYAQGAPFAGLVYGEKFLTSKSDFQLFASGLTLDDLVPGN